MTDEKIIELLFARDERALAEIEKKYSNLCKYTAGNFLNSREDVEECINDMLLAVWNHIPPEKPECLPAYITVLVRNAASAFLGFGRKRWKEPAQLRNRRKQTLCNQFKKEHLPPTNIDNRFNK